MSTNPRRLSWMDEIRRVHLSPSTSSDALALPCSIKIMWNRLIDGFDESEQAREGRTCLRAMKRSCSISSSGTKSQKFQSNSSSPLCVSWWAGIGRLVAHNNMKIFYPDTIKLFHYYLCERRREHETHCTLEMGEESQCTRRGEEKKSEECARCTFVRCWQMVIFFLSSSSPIQLLWEKHGWGWAKHSW